MHHADQPLPPPRRRRRSGPKIAFAIGLVLFAVLALVLAPRWFPVHPALDDTAIGLERAQRRWLAQSGQDLPGQPDLSRFEQRLADNGLQIGAPVFLRIFKREFELELWMKRGGSFVLFASYPICRWSGSLGPKLKQGDHQAPEGFYSVDARALNPNSSYFRSFNLGYPNAFDAALGRTGSLIMVHGACASVGCFAMTNPQMAEIWRLVTAALSGGQKRFQVQVLPFRLTEARLEAYASHPNAPFWRMLQPGYDLFETNRLPPRVAACNGAYGFEPSGLYPNGDGGIENRCPAQIGKS